MNYASINISLGGLVLVQIGLVIVLKELKWHNEQEIVNLTIKGKVGEKWVSFGTTIARKHMLEGYKALFNLYSLLKVEILMFKHLLAMVKP